MREHRRLWDRGNVVHYGDGAHGVEPDWPVGWRKLGGPACQSAGQERGSADDLTDGHGRESF